MGDYITEFKIENSNRPNKKLVFLLAKVIYYLIYPYSFFYFQKTD